MDIAYPYLPIGRSFIYVPESNPFMAEAKRAWRELSTESMHPTGGILVKDGNILWRTGNQSRLKSDTLRGVHSRHCIRRILGIPTGKHYWICHGCATHREHTEYRLVRLSTKAGIDLRGADVYLYGHWWCCKPCWDAMIVAGIKDVYLLLGSEKTFSRGTPKRAS